MQPFHRFRMLACDFFDFSAAVGRGQDVEVARGAINRDGHIVFVEDVLGFGHQDATHLMTMDGHRKDILGDEYRLVTVMCNAHTACLPAMSDLHLCLDHDRISDDVGGFGHLM